MVVWTKSFVRSRPFPFRSPSSYISDFWILREPVSLSFAVSHRAWSLFLAPEQSRSAAYFVVLFRIVRSGRSLESEQPAAACHHREPPDNSWQHGANKRIWFFRTHTNKKRLQDFRSVAVHRSFVFVGVVFRLSVRLIRSTKKQKLSRWFHSAQGVRVRRMSFGSFVRFVRSELSPSFARSVRSFRWFGWCALYLSGLATGTKKKIFLCGYITPGNKKARQNSGLSLPDVFLTVDLVEFQTQSGKSGKLFRVQIFQCSGGCFLCFLLLCFSFFSFLN